MVDNNVNPEENQTTSQNDQPQPVYETVPEEVPSTVESPIPEELVQQDVGLPEDIPPMVYEDNKMRYIIIIGGVIFFVVILFLLLRIFLPGTSKEVKLTYWGLWEDKQIFQQVIDQYQQKHKNVKIDYVQISVKDNYLEKLVARSKNGQGPDIFRFHNTWLRELRDVAAPLPSSVMSNGDFEKTFYPIHTKDLKIGNNYYGIPLEIDGLVLIYNDEIFKNAGITTPPTTWEDVLNIVSKVTVKDSDGTVVTAGMAMGTATNVDHFSDIIGMLLLQNGVDLTKLDTKEAAVALEFYRQFAEPSSGVQTWDEGMPNSVTAFAQGKVAMIVAPSWEIIDIKAVNPDMSLKVAPVPYVPGSKPISLANYWVEGVSKYSQNQLEVWKFLKYLSEKDTMTKLYEAQSKIRLFGEPYSRVDLASTLAQNEYIGAVVKQGDVYESLPLVSRTYDFGLNDGIVKYLENAVNETVNGVAYDAALRTTKQGVDQLYDRYKIQEQK